MKFDISIVKKVVAGVLVLLVIRYAIKKSMGGGTGNDPVPQKPNGTTPPKFVYDQSKVNRDEKLYLSLKNSHAVAYLQVWLNMYFSEKLTIDGNFGAKTMAALLKAGKSAGSLNDMGI